VASPRSRCSPAKDVVLDAVRKEGTREGGQLPLDKCGILIIGGLSLKQLDLDRLAHGAEALFAARTLSHIGAIHILSIGIHITDPDLLESSESRWLRAPRCRLGSESGSFRIRATSVSFA
jgi:hypothetical protein